MLATSYKPHPRSIRWFALAVTLLAGTVARAGEVDAARLDAVCQTELDAKSSPGLVLAVVDARGHALVRGCGHRRVTDGTAPDGATLFELGSLTKIFTSMILADMVVKHEVALDDPIGKYLPPSVKVPSFGGRTITLVDLATHTSGLPRLPLNFAPKDFADPYASYHPAELYAFLSSYALTRAPGATFEYSNLGAGLLAHVLGLAARRSYAELVRERITGPLGLRATALTDAPAPAARIAVGQSAFGGPAAVWHFDVLAGAGALRSDGDDMAAFMRAQLRPPRALAAALALMRAPRHTAEGEWRIGLGWLVSRDGRTVWHNGETFGFHSYVALDPIAHVGVAVLANRAAAPAERIGKSILDELRRR